MKKHLKALCLFALFISIISPHLSAKSPISTRIRTGLAHPAFLIASALTIGGSVLWHEYVRSTLRKHHHCKKQAQPITNPDESTLLTTSIVRHPHRHLYSARSTGIISVLLLIVGIIARKNNQISAPQETKDSSKQTTPRCSQDDKPSLDFATQIAHVHIAPQEQTKLDTKLSTAETLPVLPPKPTPPPMPDQPTTSAEPATLEVKASPVATPPGSPMSLDAEPTCPRVPPLNLFAHAHSEEDGPADEPVSTRTRSQRQDNPDDTEPSEEHAATWSTGSVSSHDESMTGSPVHTAGGPITRITGKRKRTHRTPQPHRPLPTEPPPVLPRIEVDGQQPSQDVAAHMQVALARMMGRPGALESPRDDASPHNSRLSPSMAVISPRSSYEEIPALSPRTHALLQNILGPVIDRKILEQLKTEVLSLDQREAIAAAAEDPDVSATDRAFLQKLAGETSRPMDCHPQGILLGALQHENRTAGDMTPHRFVPSDGPPPPGHYHYSSL